jgi:cation diffusion facilitator CzcD-associated flavoprotein CzcO
MAFAQETVLPPCAIGAAGGGSGGSSMAVPAVVIPILLVVIVAIGLLLWRRRQQMARKSHMLENTAVIGMIENPAFKRGPAATEFSADGAVAREEAAETRGTTRETLESHLIWHYHT